MPDDCGCGHHTVVLADVAARAWSAVLTHQQGVFTVSLLETATLPERVYVQYRRSYLLGGLHSLN